MAKIKVVICPYCGDTQTVGERCRACGGFFEPLSRQATHNAMGPWFVRDESKPFQPGASYETILKLIERGQITKYSIIRGPTTKQFWTVARRVPGLSHVLGYCHNCDASVDAGDHGCHACGVPFGAYLDRDYLGLPDVSPLPWEADAQEMEMRSPAARIDFRRAAEPLGISSFASDDELRSAGVGPVAAPVGAGLSPSAGAQTAIAPDDHALGSAWQGTTAVTQTMMPGPASLPSTERVEMADVGIATRAAHRKLMRQQQTIRMLVVAVFVLASLVVVGFAAWLGARRAADPQSKQAVPAPAETEQASQTPSASAPANPSESAPDLQMDSMPQTEPSASTAPEDIVHRQQEFDRAQALISAAEDASRPRPDRIADYEQALAALKKLQQAPEGVDLESIITRVERELERLKLEEFFP